MVSEPHRLVAIPLKQASTLDEILPQIAEQMKKAMPNGNGKALDATAWNLVLIIIPQASVVWSVDENESNSIPGLVIEPPGDRSVQEQFGWVFENPKNLRTLKRFFLIGWAYKNGARSLRDVLRKLQPVRPTLGAEIVPASTKDYSDCAKEITMRFQCSISLEDTGFVELFFRQGVKPAHPCIQDTRTITGLTETGWQMWEDTGQFLKMHGGAGPWDIINAAP